MRRVARHQFSLLAATWPLLAAIGFMADVASRSTLYTLSRGDAQSLRRVEVAGGQLSISFAGDPSGALDPKLKTPGWSFHTREIGALVPRPTFEWFPPFVYRGRHSGPRITPYREWVVPLWALWCPALLVPLVQVVHRVRRLRRRRLNLCPACGYDLRASPERCPECGSTVGKGAASMPD